SPYGAITSCAAAPCEHCNRTDSLCRRSAGLHRRRDLARGVNPSPIEPFQQCRELRSRQPHHPVLHVRPAELAILEPFGEQAHSRAVPIDQLHAVGTFRSEHIDCARERIGLHRLAHQCGQTLGALAEVHRLGRHPHPHRTGRTDHVPAFSARMTTATVLASAPRPTRTLTPSISTSMIPEARSTGRTCWRCRRRAVPSSNADSTTAGTNCGTSVPASALAGCRAWRRHVNNCCGASPCRRATSETTAPGTSVS